MIRVEPQDVMTYRLVEDKQGVQTETREIAGGLSREDAAQIAGLWNQAEINKKLDAVALTPGRGEFVPSADTPKETPVSGAWLPSTRYPGTFKSRNGEPCLCSSCIWRRQHS